MTPTGPAQVRALIWGTYDLGKPRTRILLRGLREAGVDLEECHAEVWAGVEDKAHIRRWAILGRMARVLAAYPGLIWRYLRAPSHDVVIVGYLGHLDVLMLWPFARLRGVPIVWDAFLSLYETVVEDRAMLRPRNPVARLLRAWDWLACRAADLVLLDTAAHAHWFETSFGLPAGRTASLFVGAEPESFAPLPDRGSRRPGQPCRILFYGQFIPLHGIETIVEAAARSDPESLVWTIIGTGQEASRIRDRLAARPVPHLTWIDWVPYAELREQMAEADICLGIFGESGKAARVIPNKAFQVIAAGRPLVTRDSPALREWIGDGARGVRLVEAGDADALLAGIHDLIGSGELEPDARSLARLRSQIGPASIGRGFKDLITSLPIRDQRSARKLKATSP